jgi:hypothetical protein
MYVPLPPLGTPAGAEGGELAGILE